MRHAASTLRTAGRLAGIVGLILLLALVGRLWSGGYLDRSAVWRFPAQGRTAPVSVLFLSGDAGMRFGMGPFVARRLAERGIDVTAIGTSTPFRIHRTRAELDAIVGDAIARAARAAGTRRLVVIGQSYGADILQTGLARLSAALRARIAGIVLIVPGTGTYFRADPIGLAYHLAPDSASIETASTLTWAPLTCIHGIEETDSVCPLLRQSNATSVRLPGGHYLDHDQPRLAAAVWHAIDRSIRDR